MQVSPCLDDPAFSAEVRCSVLQVFRSSLFPRREGLPEELDRGGRDAIPPYLLVQRFSHLSLASATRPEGLEFNQCRFNHTRFALTTQSIDDFLLRGL
jgi:hypothetical protein